MPVRYDAHRVSSGVRTKIFGQELATKTGDGGSFVTSRMLDLWSSPKYVYNTRKKKIRSNAACIMEPVCSLPCPQQHITEPYPVPHSSSRIPMKKFIQDHSLYFHVLIEGKLRRLGSNPGRNKV